MLYLIVYGLGLVDKLDVLLGCITAVLVGVIMLSFFALIQCHVEGDDKYRRYMSRVIKKSTKLLIITLSFLILIPCKNIAYQLTAVYMGKQVNQTIKLDTKLQKVSEIIDIKLDEIIKENRSTTNNAR